MHSPFAIIGTAWSFYRKQPVLNEITFWLMFLPVAALDAVGGMVETVAAQGFNTAQFTAMTAMEIAISIPLIIVLIYLVIWGQACILTVAKRLVSSPAGRTRTSFKAVRKQAKKYIGPLFLTELLRSIFTALLTLLLIVPGVIYAIRTIFYDIMMIESGKVTYGRDALKPSYNLVKGHTWEVLWRAFLISLSIYLPIGLLSSLITKGLLLVDSRLETLALVLTDCVQAFSTMFFIVCVVALYANFTSTYPAKR